MYRHIQNSQGHTLAHLIPADYSAHTNAQYEHNHTPTYARGVVCLVGDASHVLSPVSSNIPIHTL